MFYKVSYTNWIVPNGYNGITLGCFIFLRPETKMDPAILPHECTHVAQFWNNPFMPIWYLLNSKYRLKCEAEAYKVGFSHSNNPNNLRIFSGYLAHDYNVNITEEAAKQMILNAKPPTFTM